MAKRKYQRVVLIVGLLLLTMIICVLLLDRMVTLQQREKARAMGQLITKHPEMEQELIDAFENPESGEGTKDIQAGTALEEKYGYTYKGLSAGSREDNVKTGILFTLITATILIGAILLYFERRQRILDLNEEETKEKLKEYQERNQLLLEKLTIEEQKTKELVTDISHQLKTPLASLKMSYEIAQSEDFTAGERSSFLTQGRCEIDKLESLLEALLKIARLGANMIQIKPEPSGLKKTLLAAVNSVYLKALDKAIEIEVNEFNDITVLHDFKWTQEAFINVLDNAVKYSDPETKITITVSALVTTVIIEVADEGIGIPAKEFQNVFKRFYRGHSEAVKSQEGSGVGLYLVRKILEEQGGSVCVKQGASCGSIFQMTLRKA